MSESLVDPTSAVASVQQEIAADKLRWKSLVNSVSAGEEVPPANIIVRLGQAFDFDSETATAAFMDDVSLLKKHRSLLGQQKRGETAMTDWTKIHESPEVLKEELEIVQSRSVEIRTALSRHWQRESANARTYWQIEKIQNENPRVFD